MNVQRIIQPDYDEGVDRKTLKVIRDRFLKVSQGRLQRTHAALNGRQQLVLELLPLLFHVNHPLLPGYVSHQAPYRIQGYEPSKVELAAAHRFSRSFQYRDEPRRAADIQSLFLMGSTGTVAHSERSDMDIWLCHRPDLPPAQLAELQRKCTLISEWAAEMGQEMHIFLINAHDFRRGRHEAGVDDEDCGSAQHYLLLDEFYRTSIQLAGSCPLWWLIPVYNEAEYEHYTQLLEHKRFIRTRDYIDLGGIPKIPPEEFIGAGMWQLYKGIDAPYKSILKLLLTEVYAQQPDRPCLSLRFKQALYEDRLDLDELDPYVMLYRSLEEYLLARDERDRLELVRRSFYLKVGERLSIPGNRYNKTWRRLLMERLVAEWGWQAAELKRLDHRHQWKVPQVQNERRTVVNELTLSYRFLSQYARTHVKQAAIKAEDVNLLGRKLSAAFQRKAGKIEYINPGIAPNLSEEQLAFHHSSSQALGADTQGWMLFRNLPTPQDAPFHPVLKRSASLIELIAWAYFNGILTSTTSISLVAGTTAATLYELQNIIGVLRQTFPLPLPPVEQEAYRRNSTPQRCLLFVNVGIDPMEELTRQGIYKLSSRTDALGYSSLRNNLVVTLDLLSLSSWNEVSVQRFERGDTLIQCLKHYLALILGSGHQVTMPKTSVHCFCPTRASAIASRVEQLLQDLTGALFHRDQPQSARYVIEMDNRYFVVQLEDGTPLFAGFETTEELFRHLQLPQRHYSPIKLDRYAFQNTRLAAVCARDEPDKIQVFYYQPEPKPAPSLTLVEPALSTEPVVSPQTAEERPLEIYILDEQGSLTFYTGRCQDPQQLLEPLYRFLCAVQDRRQMHHSLDEGGLLNPEIQFFELVERAGQPLEVQKRRPPGGSFSDYLEVHAIGSQEHQGQLVFDLFVDDQEFHAQDYGDQLFPAVAHYLRARRAGRPLCPCYVTDLGLPHDLGQQPYQAQLHTTQYLKYKLELEQRLQQALQQFATDQG